MSQSWWPGEDSLELYFVYNIFLKICLSGKHADSSPNKKALLGLPLNCLDEQSGGGDETAGANSAKGAEYSLYTQPVSPGKTRGVEFFGRAWEEFSRRARKGRSWRSQWMMFYPSCSIHFIFLPNILMKSLWLPQIQPGSDCNYVRVSKIVWIQATFRVASNMNQNSYYQNEVA